jgi:hypothetical protein
VFQTFRPNSSGVDWTMPFANRSITYLALMEGSKHHAARSV